MSRANRSPSLRALATLASLTALAAGCGGSASPVDPAPQADAAPPVDTGPPLAQQSCKASATVTIAVPVAEVRAKTPTQVSLMLAEAGNAEGSHPLKVVLLRDGAEVKTLLDAPKAESLTGGGGGGAGALGVVSIPFLASDVGDMIPGSYSVRASLGCPSGIGTSAPGKGEAPLYVLRLGAKSVNVGDGDGARVPLMYHAVNHARHSYYPIDASLPVSALVTAVGEPELDTLDGKARAFGEVWTDLETPPVDATGKVALEGHTLPVSLTVGTRPDLTFTMGKTARGPGGSVVSAGLDAQGVPAIRLVLDAGSTAPTTDVDLVTDGGAVTVRPSLPALTTIGRIDVKIAWHFEVKTAAGEFKPIAGATQEALLRFYGVLGNDQGTAAPNLPWVAVVDEAIKKIAGKTIDPAEARAILVQHIYEEMDLTYDRASGAAAYTNNFGGPDGFATGVFDLTDFLKRGSGNIVNCSDCASILSTYANMIGAKLHYAIIGWNFALNPIIGIGGTKPGAPFDSGRAEFSYHAVTSPDATVTIDDATLALNGATDPAKGTFVRLLVQNVAGADYLKRLSPATPEYVHADQKTTVR